MTFSIIFPISPTPLESQFLFSPVLPNLDGREDKLIDSNVKIIAEKVLARKWGY